MVEPVGFVVTSTRLYVDLGRFINSLLRLAGCFLPGFIAVRLVSFDVQNECSLGCKSARFLMATGGRVP